MTRSLFILRHGKSDWSSNGGSDHDRPLKKRGRASARLMGRFLSSTEQAPGCILASSAVRARTTAELVREAGGWDCPLLVEDALYHATPASIIERVGAVDDDVERLLVVGHEPTLSALVGELVGAPPPAFPTGTLARVDFEAARWSEIAAKSGTLALLIPPRLLEAFSSS